MAFAAYQDLEDRLRVAFDAAEQVQAAALLDAATALIKAEADQTIEQVANDSVALDGTGGRRVVLPEWPVTSVASVTVDGDALVFADDYQWTVRGVLLRVGAVWPCDIGNIAVVYTHGYPATPPVLSTVCVEMSARAWSTPASGAVTQESIGSYSVSYDTAGEAVTGLELKESERRVVADFGRVRVLVG